ncbi:MAG TPA: DUF2007 domain-containing protein [Nitrolancea sp.]|nr:DUF2007 domain-containing protein [Nitrolancea sp.]
MTDVEHPDDELVKVAVAPNEMIATMWLGWLDEEGIKALARVGGSGPAYFGTMINERSIYVLERDAERAREILAEDDDVRG